MIDLKQNPEAILTAELGTQFTLDDKVFVLESHGAEYTDVFLTHTPEGKEHANDDAHTHLHDYPWKHVRGDDGMSSSSAVWTREALKELVENNAYKIF